MAGVFILAALLLLVLLAMVLAYMAVVKKLKTEQEIAEREMEHEERKELFEDEEL